jgi:DUF4097 and DUF4098 domain-containing protein YvlB
VLACLGALPAVAAERRVDDSQRFPAAEGKRVVIDVGSLNLRMRSADVDDVELLTELRISGVGGQKAENWIEANTPAIDDRDDELRVTTSAGKNSFLGLGYLTARARLGVITPSHIIPDLTTTSGAIRLRGDFPLADPLRLRTSAGDMSFEGAARGLDIRTVGGNVDISVFRPLDELFARTSSGSIRFRGGARQAEVDTASGNVSMSNLSGSVLVETSTGRVTLQWDHLDADDHVVVRSASGKIELMLPPGIEPRGTLITTTGAIHCDFSGTWNDREDSLNLTGDGPLFEIETASSEITAEHGYADFD